MTDIDSGFPDDEAPEGDAAAQQQSVEFDDEAGLDTDYLTAGDRDANEADVIEQAYIVPDEDDWAGDR